MNPAETLRPLRRARQFREFTDEPLSEDELQAVLNVARWTGSGNNSQPWRFIVLRDRERIQQIAEMGLPSTRALRTAPTIVAITLPEEPDRQLSLAYDDGRITERFLIAASMLGAGAGIAWVRTELHQAIGSLLGVPPGRFVRTIMALGHPSAAALAPKQPGQPARLPLDDLLLDSE
jgi:nitroreductase